MLVCTTAAGLITPETGGRIMVRSDICDPNIYAGLRKQSCSLASMVRLMVEEMHDKAEEILVCDHALGVCIMQNVI